MTGVCGEDMGGIWMDGPNGSRTFMLLRCNVARLTQFHVHQFYDPLSGMRITKTPWRTRREVDARGCVRDY